MSTTTHHHDHPALRQQGPSYSTRTVGYAIGALVNIVLLTLINGWPGWQEFGFLTADAGQVVPLVNVSLVFGVALNAVYLISDPEWLRGLGDAVSAAFATAILLQLVLVFPFSVPNDGVEVGLTIGLLAGAVGAGIAVIAGIVRFVKGLVAPE